MPNRLILLIKKWRLLVQMGPSGQSINENMLALSLLAWNPNLINTRMNSNLFLDQTETSK